MYAVGYSYCKINEFLPVGFKKIRTIQILEQLFWKIKFTIKIIIEFFAFIKVRETMSILY